MIMIGQLIHRDFQRVLIKPRHIVAQRTSKCIWISKQVTAELITMLANMDHEVNIQKRNADDHEDSRNKAFKANMDPDSEEADTTPDPIDVESYRRYMESRYQDDTDEEDEDPIEKFVHEFLLGLGDADQTIMFAVFGSGEEQKDAAAELNRTTQSVSRTIQRIKARLKKQLADELGYTGQDRTMPEK